MISLDSGKPEIVKLTDFKGRQRYGLVFTPSKPKQQGIDLLASHLLLTRPTKIFMPDVFKGKPYPPDKDGQKEVLQEFFAGT